MMRNLIVFAAMFVSFAGVCFSDTIHIPADYPTIQQGLDAAQNGDIVLVAPGTYVENVDFLGKAVSLESEIGPEATVIDGNGSGPVVTFSNGEGSDTQLLGFTVTNGRSQEDGGGVLCSAGSPKLIKNVITRNESIGSGAGIACLLNASPQICHNTIRQNKTESGGGGGIYCKNSSPMIKSNIITQNESGFWFPLYESASTWNERHELLQSRLGPNEADGGGILLINGSEPVICYNTISHNKADYGGGIHCADSDAEIFHNKILDNTADPCGGGIYLNNSHNTAIDGNLICGNGIELGGGGAGIWCRSSTPTIQNNIICRNINGIQHFYGGDGGGICFSHSSPKANITNNTIFENYVHGFGGGIASIDQSFPIVANTILWGNETTNSTLGREIYVGDLYSAAGLEISYSVVKDGIDSVFVHTHGQLTWGDGMIELDPIFVDSAKGDFHLTYDSPCRDSGDSAALFLPDVDFESDPRIAYGTVDMGADEFYTHLYYTGNAAPGESVEGKFVGLPGVSPVGLWFGSKLLKNPVHTPYGEWHLQPPWVSVWPLGLIPPDGVLILTARVPHNVPAPSGFPMQALIGLDPDSLTNPCVLKVR